MFAAVIWVRRGFLEDVWSRCHLGHGRQHEKLGVVGAHPSQLHSEQRAELWFLENWSETGMKNWPCPQNPTFPLVLEGTHQRTPTVLWQIWMASHGLTGKLLPSWCWQLCREAHGTFTHWVYSRLLMCCWAKPLVLPISASYQENVPSFSHLHPLCLGDALFYTQWLCTELCMTRLSYYSQGEKNLKHDKKKIKLLKMSLCWAGLGGCSAERQPWGMQPGRGESQPSPPAPTCPFPPLCEPTVDFLNFPLMFISPQ